MPSESSTAKVLAKANPSSPVDYDPRKTFLEIAAGYAAAGKPVPGDMAMLAAEESLCDMGNEEFPAGTEFFDVAGAAVAKLREGFCIAVDKRGLRPCPRLSKALSHGTPISAEEFGRLARRK